MPSTDGVARMNAEADGLLPESFRQYVGTSSDSGPTLRFLERHPSLLQEFWERPPIDDDESGRELEGYRLDRRIARGGFSSVYAARSLRDGQWVALKVSRPQDEPGARSLMQEAEIARILDHPNLVRVHEAGRVADRAFAAFELLPGPSLAKLLDDESVAPRRVLGWFGEIASALSKVHEAGIVHRDVKPANIVLDDAGQARLVDFGLAVSSARRSEVRELAGTLPYMSPEQTLGGLAAVTPASDVYSLAISMLEFWAGERFAERFGRSRVLETVAFMEVPLGLPRRVRRQLPPLLGSVLAKALRKLPAERYADADELHADLMASIRDAPLPNAAESRLTRSRRWLRNHSTLTRTTVAAVAVLTTAAVVHDWLEGTNIEQRVRAFDTAVRERQSLEIVLDRFESAWEIGAIATPLRDVLLHHHATIGHRLTQQLLRTTGLRVGSVTPIALRTSVMARRIHSTCGGADFALQATWVDLMQHGAEFARTTLRSFPESASGDPRLAEVAALLAAESGDPEELASAEERVSNSHALGELTLTELSLRAYRLVHRVRVARRVAKLAIPPERRRVLLAEARESLDFAIERDADNRLARTTLALWLLETNDPAAARARFEELLSRSTDPLEQHALRLHVTLARSMSLPSSEDPLPNDTSHDARSVWWLTQQAAIYQHSAALSHWLVRLEPEHLPSCDRPVLLSIAHETLLGAVADQSFERLHETGTAIGHWQSDEWADKERHGHAGLLLYACEVALQVADHLGDSADGRHWSARATELARHALAIGLPRRAEFEAVLHRAQRLFED